jgi:DNA-binding response OmpR family regulator/predicted regulator of Ras-like GTPase activity (Roadblock/LC7/MglB family)
MELKQSYLFQVVVTMSDVWRICVIEGDVSLNQNLVSSLRKDGYVVQGVINSADAMRVLWSEEYDVVICSLNLPGADGLELLRWLRAYRSNVRPIVLGGVGSVGDSNQRMQALESGAVSFIEKPVDLRLLKDELRRLLQQTGFTASLDSFDLLDVIQIINMSRKSITLLINIGLEERGALRFQDGELAWAEYGMLRGEEAFFALAAHKNGTVTQQLSDNHFVANVTQPLSRLIFQALQYRTKYANGQGQQYTQEPEAVFSPPSLYTPNDPVSSQPFAPFLSSDIDDTPFVFTSEGIESTNSASNQQQEVPRVAQPTPVFPLSQEQSSPMAQFELPPIMQPREKEWWELTGKPTNAVGDAKPVTEDAEYAPTFSMDLHKIREAINTSQALHLSEEPDKLEEPSGQLPSWLTEQPTSSRIPVQIPTHFPSSPQLPVSPPSQPLSGDMWQVQPTHSAQVPFKTTDELLMNQQSSAMQAFAPETEERRPSSPLWTQPQVTQKQPSSPQNWLTGQSGVFETTQAKPNTTEPQSNGVLYADSTVHTPDILPDSSSNNSVQSSTPPPTQSQPLMNRKNYAALVSALQTLGYSIPGFIAAAVVDIDSHPIAQVAIDDADISHIWQLLSAVQQSALDALQSDEWGAYEETAITTALRHVLMRVIGSDKKAFLVLITTREANFAESLEIMANVEGAISAALC